MKQTLSLLMKCIDGLLNVSFKRITFSLCELIAWKYRAAVGVVAFNTRLGCLNPNLAPDSEAQKMIDTANYTFTATNELEFGFPVWKYYKTEKLKKLYEAQDFITKYLKLLFSEKLNCILLKF